MKTKQILILTLGLLMASLSRAQEADALMKQVLERNPGLKVAREASRTAMLQAGTGNTPPDPQVEFGYLFGDPSGIGNKINIVVKQEVDFPTAYVHRSRIREIRTNRAELEYMLVRQEVLSLARQTWIEQVHLNQLSQLLDNRLRTAREVEKLMKEMLDAGEVGLLEYNQAVLMVASVESEFDEVQSRMASNKLILTEMTGGLEMDIRDTLFPSPVFLVKDSLLMAYRSGPAALLHRKDWQEKEQEIKLAQSKHLPKLSAGYFSEAIPSEAFRGFTLGVSVPLWENARQVKTAQSALLGSEAAMDSYFFRMERELRQKLTERDKLLSRVLKLETALGSANSLDLLALSLESGEISLTEYFYGSDFYFRNQQLMLRYRRDLLTLEADLLKVYL
jgi:outer membrane protein TolC